LPTHDFVSLENQPSHIGMAINPFATLDGDVAPDEGYVFGLPATYDDFTRVFRAETRRADRSKLRKLEALGKVEFRIAETNDEARRMVADILDRKATQLRAQGVTSIFEDAGYRAAYIALAALPPKRKLLQVATLTLDGEFLSGSIAHVRQGHVTLMVHTFEHEYARLSPGRLHLLKLIEQSITEGHEIYDLSVGSVPYKDSFCAEPMALSNFVVSTKPWGLAAASAERARLGLKRRVKSNDRLMDLLRGFRQKWFGR
jgi:CelD/BcsL family acetyltransferase involved in cellulose biosynthesis